MNFRIFRDHLKGVAIAKAILDLISIPVNLLSAGLLADIVLYATDGDTHSVLNSGLALALLLAGYKIFETICRIRLELSRSKTLQGCKLELYERFLSGPLAALYSGNSGQAKERLTDDFDTSADQILSVYPGVCVGLLIGTTYFIFIARLSWLTAVILTVLALIQIIPPLMTKNYFEKNYKETRDIEAQLTDFITEAHHGFAVLKLYDLKNWYIEKLKKLHRSYAKIGNSGIYTNTAENMLNEFVSTALKYGTYALGGRLALKGIVSMDTGVEVVMLSGSYFAAVRTVFSSVTRFVVTKEAQNRLSQWFVKEREVEKKKISDTHVNLTGVSLSYEDKTVFDCASITFPTNGICLIKGANGAGKSTLFKLIAGMIRADQGVVQVGGVTPDVFGEDIFPQEIFYLPQEDADFALSPRDFYAMIYGEEFADVIRLTRSFGLGDQQLNETKISELSGGERKKVFLSLALAVNPKILLLDEPTNSLDEDSKKMLIRELKKRVCLTLIITHDPVFDQVCDHLYVVREGGVEDGKK